MSVIRRTAVNFIKNENGATFLEYTVLLGFIVVISITGLRVVGDWAGG